MSNSSLKLLKIEAKILPEQSAALLDMDIVMRYLDGATEVSSSDGDCGEHRHTHVDFKTGKVVIEIPNFNPNVGGWVKEDAFKVGELIDINIDGTFGCDAEITNVSEIPLHTAKNAEGINTLRNFCNSMNK